MQYTDILKGSTGPKPKEHNLKLRTEDLVIWTKGEVITQAGGF